MDTESINRFYDRQLDDGEYDTKGGRFPAADRAGWLSLAARSGPHA